MYLIQKTASERKLCNLTFLFSTEKHNERPKIFTTCYKDLLNVGQVCFITCKQIKVQTNLN